MSAKSHAAEHYRQSVNVRNNEELAELVQLHLGPTHLNTLKAWVQGAYIDGYAKAVRNND